MSRHIVIDARIRPASSGRPIDRLLEYLQALDKDNTYTILLQPDDPWEPVAPNFRKVVCKYKRFSVNPFQQITFSLFLYRLKPDLVHFGMTGFQPLLYFGKQITMTHDLTMYEYVRAGRLPQWLHRLRMIGYRLLVYIAHRKAKRIIVPTQYVRQHLSKFQPFTAAKITVTLEAGEPPLSIIEQKPKFAVERFILSVGTAFPHKNLEGVVNAFGLLHEHDPSLRLVLAGKKEYHYEQLDAYIATKPYAQQVITPGFVSDGELKWLYGHARAYVFASFSEGFGLPGLEAMAHGCPVVSSNATCLPEVYDGAAHYFNPQDPTDMAKRIQEVLDSNTLRSDLVEKGKKQVAQYSWRRMAEQTLEVYKHVLG